MKTPTYTHDCDACIFLGVSGRPMGGPPTDWYYCRPRPDAGPESCSVIARYSSEPGDYWSSPESMLEGSPYPTFTRTEAVRMMGVAGIPIRRGSEAAK